MSQDNDRSEAEPAAPPTRDPPRRDPPSRDPPSRDPMYRAIVGLLVVDVVFGLGLAVFAEAVLEIRQIAFLGLAMALLGIAILAFYVALGRRADHRAKVATKEPGNPE